MAKVPRFAWVVLWLVLMTGGFVVYQLRAYESDWQPALSVVDRERLFEIIRDNSHDLSRERDFTTILAGIEIKFLRPFGSPELAVVNFNSKNLCGIAGCLYAVYQTEKPSAPLFQWLLSPALPESVPLFTTSEKCLVVNQYLKRKNQQISIKYCNLGKSYAETDKLYIDSSNH
jgi:hypothetical protein